MVYAETYNVHDHMLLKQNHPQVVLSEYNTGSTVGDFVKST